MCVGKKGTDRRVKRENNKQPKTGQRRAKDVARLGGRPSKAARQTKKGKHLKFKVVKKKEGLVGKRGFSLL